MNSVDPTYRNTDMPVSERVENLFAQMTLAEKAGFFFQTMIAIGPDGELAGRLYDADLSSADAAGIINAFCGRISRRGKFCGNRCTNQNSKSTARMCSAPP